MSLHIKKAIYHNKDVTDLINSKIIGDSLMIQVENSKLGGDPAIGVFKKIEIDYSLNNIDYVRSYSEGDLIALNNNSNRVCGIFYTDNFVNDIILQRVVDCIDMAAVHSNVTVIHSIWEKTIEYPNFYQISNLKNRSHFNIIYQICSLLSILEQSGNNYEYVAFLEHDVLYPIDYFNFEDFEGDIVCNTNFMGLEQTGFSVNRGDLPQHQLIMRFNYAVNFYKNLLYMSINNPVCVEPDDKSRFCFRKTINPSIHINARCGQFTSHCDTYSIKDDYINHPEFGHYTKLIHDLDL